MPAGAVGIFVEAPIACCSLAQGRQPPCKATESTTTDKAAIIPAASFHGVLLPPTSSASDAAVGKAPSRFHEGTKGGEEDRDFHPPFRRLVTTRLPEPYP